MTATVATKVPASKYALVRPNGDLGFCEVSNGRKGTKWENYQFVTLLFGAPGDWRRVSVRNRTTREQILSLIAGDPLEAAVRFSQEFTVCAACGSPLTDAESRAAGLGPICRERF